MSAPLATRTKEEQRCVILFFLGSEGVKSIEIHRRMKVQYSKCTSGLGSSLTILVLLTDSPRPGQAHPVVTPEDIAAVEAIVEEYRRLTVDEIAAHWI